MNVDYSRIGPFLIAALVVFIIYRRLRRNFGQQPLRPVRMRVRIGLFLAIGCMLAPIAARSSAFLAATAAGIAVGVSMALYGAARTRFVRDATQVYYVPHTYTGIAVSLLFLGRLLYRFIQGYGQGYGAMNTDQAFAPTAMVRSPLTVGLFFVLVSYYVCYYGMVLWKSAHAGAEPSPSSV